MPDAERCVEESEEKERRKTKNVEERAGMIRERVETITTTPLSWWSPLLPNTSKNNRTLTQAHSHHNRYNTGDEAPSVCPTSTRTSLIEVFGLDSIEMSSSLHHATCLLE